MKFQKHKKILENLIWQECLGQSFDGKGKRRAQFGNFMKKTRISLLSLGKLSGREFERFVGRPLLT